MVGRLRPWCAGSSALSTVQEFSVLSAQFCCGSKTALKIEFYFFKSKFSLNLTLRLDRLF